MLSGRSFRSTFVFSISSLILSGFPLTSFNLTEASPSAFSWFYTLVCVQVSKNIKKCLLFIITHIFSTHFAINLFFAQVEIVNKLWNNNRTMHMNKIKRKTKPSHATFELTKGSIVRFSHKQCNGIIKGWLHCLTSESKERFLVNNTLFGPA